MKEIIIKSNYNNNNINIFAKRSFEETNNVIVFIHGLYGVFNPSEKTDKINILSDKLVNSGVGHVVNYNSSRDYEFGSETSFLERQKAFANKTFEQELNDLKAVLSYAVENSEDLFGVKKENIIFYVHGNSMGGTLALLLKDFFPVIKKISLCGSGCGSNGSSKPILSTIWPEEVILESISSFNGSIFLLQGGADDVVPKESGLKILQHAANSKASLKVIEGANHNFSKINGVENQEARNIFVDWQVPISLDTFVQSVDL